MGDLSFSPESATSYRHGPGCHLHLMGEHLFTWKIKKVRLCDWRYTKHKTHLFEWMKCVYLETSNGLFCKNSRWEQG